MRRLSLAAPLALLACATPVKENIRIDGPKVVDTATQQGPATSRQPEISARAKLLFEEAGKAYEAQKKARAFDYPALERKFEAALDADRGLAEAHYNLGVLAERQGRIDDAAARYREALKAKPTLRQAAESLGVIAQNKGDVATATQIYEDIIEKFPEDASSRARLAELHRRKGDHDQAMELSRAALLREPKTLSAYKVMMRSYLDRRQLAMAKLVALRALKLDDADPELYYTIGLILLAEKDAIQARLQFLRAVEVRPDYLPAHVELAKIAMQLEDYEGVEEHLRKILQADGKNAAAHLDLGVAYKGLGQYDKAMQEYEEAERLDPKLAATYLNRGIILHRFKDAPERAVDYYKKYLSLSSEGAASPDSPVVGLLKEAEQMVQLKKEAEAAEAEQKRLEEQQKANGGTPPDAQGDVQPTGGTAAEGAAAEPPANGGPAKDKEPSGEPPDNL